MSKINVRLMLMRNGEKAFDEMYGFRLENVRYNEAKCPYCGKMITTNDKDLSGVEYVRTKRQGHIFFHRSCFDKDQEANR